MIVLAFETSCPKASMALWEDGTIVFEKTFESDRAHNAVIFEPLQQVLEECPASNLDRIAVGIGPGVYSGIRVGIAVGNALAIAGSGQTVGVSSLEAYPVESGDYLVVGDARRQTFFLAEVRDRVVQGEPELLDRESFQQKLASYPDDLPVVTGDAPLTDWTRAELSAPCAAILAAKAGRQDKGVLSPAPLEPYYLRAPYITTPKK